MTRSPRGSFIHETCQYAPERGSRIAEPISAMVKLTRLNNQIVVVNPDHIYEAEATPDTTLRLANGERIIVKETIDQLITEVVAYRRRIRGSLEGDGGHDGAGVAAMTHERHADDGSTMRGGV